MGQRGGADDRGSRPAGKLGADRSIPRRDFLQGSLIGAASALTGPLLSSAALAAAASSAPQDQPGYYPPLLTGLRGSHPGSFEAAHALRDGAGVPPAEDAGEDYDLVVVGAGISGLSAAHFFQAGTAAGSRILILDNHDDFGGHAKRNEFKLAGRMLLMNGGTLEIDSPRPYSATAQGLLRQLGIDVPALKRRVEDRDYYEKLGMRSAAFLDAETFGADKMLSGVETVPMRALLKDSPLSARARADLVRIHEGTTRLPPGTSPAAMKEHLSRISYRDFLRDIVKADPAALAYMQARTQGYWAVGTDAISALDCWAFGLPGFKAMNLPAGTIERMGPTAAGYYEAGGSVKLRFPDGNATIARLLVRRLVPGVAAGSTAEDIVTERFDYSRLDRASAPVRVRLSSIVVRVRHAGNPDASSPVEVTYLRDGRALKVRARRCVLACWNMMIPYLCPELPPAQQAALHSLVKAPLIYTSVALRNWRPFKALGVREVYAPGSYYTSVWLDQKTDIGTYHSASHPDQPTLVHLERTPCSPGLAEHEQNKAGRAELLGTSFATLEQKTREQLLRMLGPGGFDPARDIQAITVNRWPHGYTPEYNPLFDPEVPPAQRANVLARARFGSISIANADAGGLGYTDGAIDQAYRAVNELLTA